MSIFNKLFCCQDSLTLTPLVIHKTISQNIENDEFFTEMWIRKTENIHCKFDYKLTELLGQGAGGKVYLAEAYDQNQQQMVMKCAMKVLSKSKLEQQRNYKKYLILEKRIQSQVKSNFILKFIESFQSKSYCFISLQFAEGGSVASYLNTKRRKLIESKLEDVVKFIAACVFLGLKSLHSNNFVYRDLKPQNLLIMHDGYVKLSDFGLADQIYDNEIINGCKAGTLPYLAPEMQLQLGHNKLIDFWCLGVLIFQLFTTKTPFSDIQIYCKSFKQIVKASETSRRYFDPLIPPAASDLIRKLLRAEKDQRLGSNSIDDIKRHEFFEGIDWEALESQILKSPLSQSLKECSTQKARSRKCSSTDDEQDYSYKNVSLFTTEGSPAKLRKLNTNEV